MKDTECSTFLSDRTIARRWKDMGLKASGKEERELSPQEIVNIVAEELEMDPEGTMGQSLIKHRIAMRTGKHLKQYVEFDPMEPLSLLTGFPPLQKEDHLRTARYT